MYVLIMVSGPLSSSVLGNCFSAFVQNYRSTATKTSQLGVTEFVLRMEGQKLGPKVCPSFLQLVVYTRSADALVLGHHTEQSSPELQTETPA